MIEIDAERYLRQCGEDLLARHPRDDEEPGAELETRARALVDVGALDVDTAVEVMCDYVAALRLRGHHVHYADAPGVHPDPVRVVHLGRTVATKIGTVALGTLMLQPDRTTLSARIDLADSADPGTPDARRRAMRMHQMHQGPPTLSLGDDRRGRAVHAHFDGGGGDDSAWTGQFRADRALAVDTAWITVEGTRVEVLDVESDTAVSVVELSDNRDIEHRARDYVARLANGSRHSPADAALAVDTFVGAGIATVAIAPASGPGSSQPWMFANPAHDPHGNHAPRRHRPVCVVTPVLDGVRLIVLELDEVGAGHATVSVQLTGAAFPHHHGVRGLRRPVPSFTARDDTGMSYAAEFAQMSGGDDETTGTLVLDPALAPAATRLDLTLTARTRAVTVSIPLRWDES